MASFHWPLFSTCRANHLLTHAKINFQLPTGKLIKKINASWYPYFARLDKSRFEKTGKGYRISPAHSISQKFCQGSTVIWEEIFLGRCSFEMIKLLRHLFSSWKRWRPFVRSATLAEALTSIATSASPRIRSTFEPLAVLQKLMGNSSLL